jgi:hypothetical protein
MLRTAGDVGATSCDAARDKDWPGPIWRGDASINVCREGASWVSRTRNSAASRLV